MLPDLNQTPASVEEDLGDLLITPDRGDGDRVGHSSSLTSGATVPDASVDLDSHLLQGNREVGEVARMGGALKRSESATPFCPDACLTE